MVYEKIIENKWCEDVLDETNVIIQTAYRTYEPLYKFVLEYIKSRKLLISSADLLINGLDHLNYNKPIQIYTLIPEEISKDLFNQFCKEKGKFFSLNTEIFNEHYSIEYQTKQFARISNIKQYKNTSLIDFMLPVNISKLLVLPPILELIDLYKKLYNPEYADEWEGIIKQTDAIQIMANKNIYDTMKEHNSSVGEKQKTNNSVGGIKSNSPVGEKQKTNSSVGKKQNPCDNCNNDTDIPPVCKSCKDKRNSQVDEVKELLIEFLSTYADYVVIHKFNESPLKGKNIEIISQNNIETDFERLNNFISKLSVDNKTIMFKQKNLFIGKDIRILKYTFFLTMAKYGNQWDIVKKPFLDIYNNSSYELIPYEPHTHFDKTERIIKYAHPWVQIRFYYIEIWNILAAYKLKALSWEQYSEYISDILKNINKIQIKYNVDMPKKYTGIYYNEFQSYKQVMLQDGKNGKIYC